MAITNQLIDDYTLKGAKGLLVNITGGKDLKLFEVDEAVNKVKPEVDPEAELIIGAITDPALEGIMRVSIVATALDGQQPESKSVINMVHRIQNRNPGYFDTSSIQKNNNLNINNNSNFIPSTSGANALQVNNEDIKETENELLNSMVDENMALSSLSNEEALKDNEHHSNLIEETPLNLNDNTEENQDSIQENSNGLENFELGEGSPQLFNSGNEILDENKEENQNIETDEDELEIPAFLRRQKN